MHNKKLKFEIEYINGVGKGKEYNHNGVIIFEGEYINGKELKGKGKEFDAYEYLLKREKNEKGK